MMKALVVYESMFGNTELVARAIARGLQTSATVELVEVTDAPRTIDPEIGLIVAGGPTHAFSMSRESTRAQAIARGAGGGMRELGLREWLDELPEGGHHEELATFDTRVESMRHLPGSAARSAARSARRHGFDRTGPTMSFYVEDVEGPLLPGEVERAERWGAELADALPFEPECDAP